MKSTFFYLCLCFASVQCATKKLSLTQHNDKLFEMSKSPCFGKCPVYTVTVFQNGSMQLTAKENMTLKGKYTLQMSQPELNSFKAKLKSLNLLTLRNEYREPIADAPATHIVYSEGDSTKKIFTNFLFPDSLQNFTEQLDKMVQAGRWTQVIDHRILQEYIIQLKQEARLAEILQRYTSYEMTLVRRLDPATNQYWVLSARVDPGSSDQLLSLLKSDKDIQSAQTNKSLESR
jgi:hypothetical protein